MPNTTSKLSDQEQEKELADYLQRLKEWERRNDIERFLKTIDNVDNKGKNSRRYYKKKKNYDTSEIAKAENLGNNLSDLEELDLEIDKLTPEIWQFNYNNEKVTFHAGLNRWSVNLFSANVVYNCDGLKDCITRMNKYHENKKKWDAEKEARRKEREEAKLADPVYQAKLQAKLEEEAAKEARRKEREAAKKEEAKLRKRLELAKKEKQQVKLTAKQQAKEQIRKAKLAVRLEKEAAKIAAKKN
jgi:hypothetical protein